MTSSDVETVCRTEAQRVLTALRANRRFGSQSRGWRELEVGSPLRQLSEWRFMSGSSPDGLLEPLLRIIRSPEFGGPATFVALEAAQAVVLALCEEQRSAVSPTSDSLRPLAATLLHVCKATCECVFEETNAQTDEATAAQMISLLGYCCTAPLVSAPACSSDTPAALACSSALTEEAVSSAFPPEARLKAFEKVLALWSHYRQSHTLRACAQAALHRMLDFALADLGSPARCEFMRLMLGKMAAEAEPSLQMERALLYIRCIQRVVTHPAAKRWASADGLQGRFFQNNIPLFLLSLNKLFTTSLPVLCLLLPVVNRICWLCIDFWADGASAAPGRGPNAGSPLGALQVEALLGGVYMKNFELAVKPLLSPESSAGALSPEEATHTVELLLESLYDLLQPNFVLAVWCSFDGDWRRPPLLQQLAGKAVQLVGERPPSSERPLPPHLCQLCSAVLGRMLAAFQLCDGDKENESDVELERIEQQWRRRKAVWELMDKVEENPKKARAAFEKSGLAEAIPLPPGGGVAAGEPSSDEWVSKLVWLFRTMNHSIPYASVGEFFGQPKEDSEKAVAAFVETFDWGARDVEQALRSFLEAFLLPKEAQQIDRVLKVFAHAYYRKHVDFCRSSGKEGSAYLRDSDAAYTLAFSVILLNSDQHNPKLKKRMTLKDFISNNRGVNGGENFPEDVQERIFESIRLDEIKTPSSGSLVEGISPTRWEDFIQLSRKGWRDNSLTVAPQSMQGQARAFMQRLGQAIQTVLDLSLAADSGAHVDALGGMEQLLHMSLQHRCPEADRTAESLFFFGCEVFHESQSEAALTRGSSCLRAFFRTTLVQLPSMSTKQLHLLVYLSVQFAVYGMLEKALPPLDPAAAKLLTCPLLVVDPPTGVVYSFLRKISTAPFKMLSFAEEGTGAPAAPNTNGLQASQVARATSCPMPDSKEPASPSSTLRSSSAHDMVGVDAVGAMDQDVNEKAASDTDTSNSALEPEQVDVLREAAESSLQNDPLRSQIQQAFQACELETLLRAFVVPWRPQGARLPGASPLASPRSDLSSPGEGGGDAGAGSCLRASDNERQPSGRVMVMESTQASAGAIQLYLCYLSSLFLALKAGASGSTSKPGKDQDLPWWPEPPALPSIGAPQPLQLPKRSLALNVLDGFETLRLALRLLSSTVGQLRHVKAAPAWDLASMHELAVCTHVGLFHTLRRQDLSERTLRLGLTGLFQVGATLLTLETDQGPAVSLGWPVRLIEVLTKRCDAEPQLLVPMARLCVEAVRDLVIEVSLKRQIDSPELWRALIQLLLKAAPTAARALWPGTKDKEVERVQLQLWQWGLVWLLGHPQLVDSSVEEKDRGGPSDSEANTFWAWALGELSTLAHEVSSARGSESSQLLLYAYRTLLGGLGQQQSSEEYAREPGEDWEEPAAASQRSAAGTGELARSRSFVVPADATSSDAAKAAAWSRVAVSMMDYVAPEITRQRSTEEPDLRIILLLKQTLLHVRVAPLLASGLHGPFWSRSVLEKLVTVLTGPVTSGAPLPVVREAVTLVSKFFLQNLQCLQRHECFGQLWLMVVRLMLQFVKRGSDERDTELEEVATETLKNQLSVLVSTQVLGFVQPKAVKVQKVPTSEDPSQPVWWQMTWDCIELFIPGFCEEFSKWLGQSGPTADEASQAPVAASVVEAESAATAGVGQADTASEQSTS
eukprot:TRINITY_DN35341_c0_g1_i1.p1 TRINITY_DN35341_c0_g1~~TRINITY_DN35341_c0_g1_i1.p1  ORF type:complete len:1704 (-),score=334.25 TRINITY_DN35341_c0_g1_i1:44-5104(-)